MPRGPLPKPGARRHNPPTIPTTSLPVSGRTARPPTPPKGYELSESGKRWWRWAWKLPQAAAWDDGALYHVARRAQLEDDLAAMDSVRGMDLADLLDLGDSESEAIKRVEFVLGRLKGLAGGRLTVLREMRELDERLGLNPAAMAKLRWTIVTDEPAAVPSPPQGGALPSNVRRMRAFDPEAATA
jgi:hypothetical protein